jgi:beta-N-acetylhexosaminidase
VSLGPLMIDLEGVTVTPEETELMRHPLVGGVILFTRNYVDPEQLTQLVAAIHAVRSPPLIVGVDHEFDLNAKTGLGLARNMGWLMAAELRSVGVDISFAPDVDLDYGISEIIGDRAFHARPQAVGQLAVAYMLGMREAGMSATAKHFPAHGAVVADSHTSLPVDRRELADMSDDLAPYYRLIANGLPAVMAAHVLFPEVDSLPASLSSRWIRDVLRGDLRFQGVVFSDDISMGGAAAAYGDIVTRARQALSAGCDMLPVCNNRAGVVTLLDRLNVEPEPTSRLRLVRMHGKDGVPWRELSSVPEWKRSRELLARCTAAPTLSLEAGRT